MKLELLNSLILNHRNEYGFNPSDVLTRNVLEIPSLSVIIPYYEAGKIINKTLHFLYSALNEVQIYYPDWKYEVLILDDGSKTYPLNSILELFDRKHLKTFSVKKNLGRVLTRNEGLKKSKNAKCLFMDCDIFVDKKLLLHTLKLHSLCYRKNKNECITVSFFKNTSSEKYFKMLSILPNDFTLNDFRVSCVYKKSWTGCDSDNQFISKSFQLIQETNFFRDWKGKVGPWYLTNMVLGGFFTVDRDLALDVNGFDSRFFRYGFTETSLPTKLIAVHGCFLVPQIIGGAIHLKSNPAHLSKNKRDYYFRKAHDLYFNNYLYLTLGEAINNPLYGW